MCQVDVCSDSCPLDVLGMLLPTGSCKLGSMDPFGFFHAGATSTAAIPLFHGATKSPVVDGRGVGDCPTNLCNAAINWLRTGASLGVCGDRGSAGQLAIVGLCGVCGDNAVGAMLAVGYCGDATVGAVLGGYLGYAFIPRELMNDGSGHTTLADILDASMAAQFI